MNEKKLKSLMADEAFVNKLLEMETPEEVCAAFEKEGLTVTEEEINQVKEKLANADENGELLGEDDLEEVAGGFILTTTLLYGAAYGLMGIGIGEKITRRRW